MCKNLWILATSTCANNWLAQLGELWNNIWDFPKACLGISSWFSAFSIDTGIGFVLLDSWDAAFQRDCSLLRMVKVIFIPRVWVCFPQNVCVNRVQNCAHLHRVVYLIMIKLLWLQLRFQWKLKTKYEQNRILYWERGNLYFSLIFHRNQKMSAFIEEYNHPSYLRGAD